MQILIALVCGAIFGAGLTVAQMVDPRKVLNFLDVAGIPGGTWDPTLLMVFAGALTTVFAAYAVQRRMARPVLAARFEIPTRSDIDARLAGGSALFGIGWGLAGVCPGPAVAALALAGSAGVANFALFVAAMCGGMLVVRVLDRLRVQ
jgi:uncharacterized protein